MKIINHKIAPEFLMQDFQVAKNAVKFKAPPDTIILHYTAGSSAESAAAWLADPNVKASAHVVIGQRGEIYQLVPFDTIAWHAGPSAYGTRSGFNNFSIGIELDNPGHLEFDGKGFVSVFGRRYPAKDVISATHRNEKMPRFWRIFPAAQVEACRVLCEALIAKYPIRSILGHEEISPGVKLDPGPAFPLEEFRNKLFTKTPTV